MPHQIKAMEEMHNGCVVKGGVGTGKSSTALAYFYVKECGGSISSNGRPHFAEMANPKDLYIFTTARKRDSGDWFDEAARFGLGRNSDFSSGHAKVTVDSWNNIGNYASGVGAFGNYTGIKDAFIIFDEQRLVGSGAWVKAFLKLAANNRWIVLSATPGDTWMDYVPIFVANGYYKNRTEFIRKHVVYSNFTKYPKIERFIEQGQLQQYRKRVLVDMPYARATIRHTKNYIVDHDKVLFDRVAKDRWHIYEDRPLKDAGEMALVMRRLVNSDTSRLGALMELMEKHPRLIVFYNFDYELDLLRTLMKTLNANFAEYNGHKHQDTPKGKNWVYLVQYMAGNEAWNCTETDAMVFYSMNYSYKMLEQCKGRIDRLNTPYIDLWYYILRSESVIDMRIAKSLLEKRNFNEREFVQMYWPEQQIGLAA